MADDGWTDTPGQDDQGDQGSQGGWTDTATAPVSASGVASQLGRGAEAGVYHALAMPADLAAEEWQQTKGAVGNIYRDVFGGADENKSTYSTYNPNVASEALMGQAGNLSPQLDPRNYPAQNWPERIARGAGDVGTQAALGRLGASGISAARGLPPVSAPAGPLGLPAPAPSALTIGKQLAKQTTGAGIGGAGAGAGAQTGRGVAQSLIDIDPEFRRLHPATANLIEGLGGTIGGMGGGFAGSNLATRAGIPGGAAAADYSSGDLKKIAGSQYDFGKSLDVNYRVPAVSNLAFNHAQDLYNTYGSSEIMPILRKLNQFANPPAGAVAVPMRELTAWDDQLGKTVKSNLQKDGSLNVIGSAAADTQKAIRDFIKNPTPQTVHSGDGVLAARVTQDADANWAAAQRSKTLELAQKRGELPGKTVQGEVGKLTDPYAISKKLSGFTPDEREQLERFTQGSPVGNLMGSLGEKLNPSHGGGLASIPLAAVEGYHLGGLYGALAAGMVPSIASYGLHRGSEALSNRALDRIMQQTRQRSPAYQAIPLAQRPGSAFRTAVPVGLGAISGLTGQ